MENKKIVFLHELKFTERDIENIGKDTYAFVATFAYAVDEISIFLKLIIQAHGEQPKDVALLQLFAIQQNTITRVLSAKLVETINLFNVYKKYLLDQKKTEYLDALEPRIEALKEVMGSPSYKVSTLLRNKVTNHYDFQNCLKNLDGSVSPNASKSIFLHSKQGNSFSPLGEEVVFLGRFWRFYKEQSKLEGNIDRIHEWIEWNQTTAKWAIDTLNMFIFWLLDNKLPDKIIQRAEHYLEPKLFGEMGVNRLPVIFDIPDIRVCKFD